MARVHQNVVLDGRDVGERSSRRHSKFCNEGKWENFVAPLLPDDCAGRSFLEVGCNAGLFLRLATERGFRHVVGVESDRNAYRTALAYRDSHAMDYRVIRGAVGEGFDWASLPAADVTLLANLHYHLAFIDFLPLLDALQRKTAAVLVVSVDGGYRRRHWKPDPRLDATLWHFREWRKAGEVRSVDGDGDPHPRPMFSLLFESGIVSVPVPEVKLRRNDRGGAAEFVAQALADPGLDVAGTDYYQYQLRVRPTWEPGEVLRYLEGKRELVLDVRANGLRNPILINGRNYIVDGTHRYLAMKALGYRYVLGRVP